MKGVKGVIGAIDGSHIGIISQEHCNENYINRKGFPSIVLQAVCDEHKRFTDCYTGWPGSVHDARVFQNSDLSMRIQSDPFVMFPEDTHLLGDAAYPLTKFMLTPYKDNGYLTEYQKAYNYKQSATRNIIERAFALLKGKFPRMKLINSSNMSEICNIVISTCVVHNFCIDQNLALGYDDCEIEYEEEEINNFICIGSSSKDAENKRNRVANQLFRDM